MLTEPILDNHELPARDVSRLLEPLQKYLAKIPARAALTELSVAARRIKNGRELYEWLLAGYEGRPGVPAELAGKRRFVAFVALERLDKAAYAAANPPFQALMPDSDDRAASARPHARRENLIDIVQLLSFDEEELSAILFNLLANADWRERHGCPHCGCGGEKPKGWVPTQAGVAETFAQTIKGSALFEKVSERFNRWQWRCKPLEAVRAHPYFEKPRY